METKQIKIGLLEPNTGQIKGLPTNPRKFTTSDIDRIAKSIQETPELFESRPIIAVPLDGKYVILGGNLRFEGAKKIGMKKVPCIIFDDLNVEKMKEIVIKDNGSFGTWDNVLLDCDWGGCPLNNWGADFIKPEFNAEAIDSFFAPQQEKKNQPSITIQVVLSSDLAEKEGQIREIIKSSLSDFSSIKIK